MYVIGKIENHYQCEMISIISIMYLRILYLSKTVKSKKKIASEAVVEGEQKKSRQAQNFAINKKSTILIQSD